MYPHTQIRAPLSYLLVGTVIGLSLSRLIPASPRLLILLALPIAALCLICAVKESLKTYWLPAYLIAGSLTFWVYGTVSSHPEPSDFARSLPPREVTLSLKVHTVLSQSPEYATLSGFAKLIAAPLTARITPGARVYFQQDLDHPHSIPAQTGQIIQATGVLSPIQPPQTRDGFNFEDYLIENSIHYRFERTRTWSIIEPSSAYQNFIQATFERMESILLLGAPTESNQANVYTAMLLGLKDALSDEQSQRYQHSGTMHFFAISGLHIGVIATVIAQALQLLRVPRRISPWIGLPLLLTYVLVTGAAPSAVRAFLMAAFFWASFALHRQRNPMSALVCSAVCVLLIDPTQLFQVGFQLSYAVVLSILLLGLPLSAFLQRRLHPYRYLPEANYSFRQRTVLFCIQKGSLLFAISLAAWLASAPLCAAIFGYLAPIAILLNIVLVNLVALIICTGVLSLTFGLTGLTFLSSFLNHAAWLLITAIDHIIELGLQIPYATLATENISTTLAYTLLAAYLCLLFIIHTRITQSK